VIIDSSGNIYGTAKTGGVVLSSCGGTVGCGVIFELAPSGVSYSYSTIYKFCQSAVGTCTDAWDPDGQLVLDGSGNLIGTSIHGGSNSNSGGTIFKIASGGTETLLYSFCALTSCTDGQNPHDGLWMDGSGALYGTTALGGSSN
jgi:uncharacterized repeat protein (TIGR03803 family)